MKNIDFALGYAKRGFSVIPICSSQARCAANDCQHGKRPLIQWHPFQTRVASEDEIKAWFEKWPGANIGIVTGKVSDVIVLDIDPRNGGDKSVADKIFPRTPTEKTGGGGLHYFFKYREGIKTTHSFLQGVDLQSDGGCVVVEPSIHSSGNQYEFQPQRGFDGLPLGELPEWIIELANGKEQHGQSQATLTPTFLKLISLVREAKQNHNGWWTGLCPSHPDHQHSFSFKQRPDGGISSKCFKECSREEIISALGMTEEEFTGTGKTETPSFAQQIVESAEPEITELFHNQFNKPFARIRTNNHFEIKPIYSAAFKLWLGKTAYKTLEKPASKETIASAADIFAGRALFDGAKRELQNRTAEYEGAIWYDLSDEKNQAVKITSEGWEIIGNPPTLFRRQSHQDSQVTPERDGNLEELRPFVNIKSDRDWLLLKVMMVAAFVPSMAHPVLVAYGPQGSAKSTLFKLIRKLVDPSELGTVTAPSDISELSQLFDHHWFVPLDNLSKLPEWLSDAICRAVTGDGFTKRELYSDEEDVVFHYQRVIGINGINLVVSKPDLLDRSILLEFERVAAECRQTENGFWDNFEKIRPRILGAIFTAISKALGILASIQLATVPRMADFARWGCAIARALGHSQEEFLEAYQANLTQQNDEVIQGHPIALCLVHLLRNRESWEGTASELLEALTELAELSKINVKSYEWPKGANVLSRRLNELKVNLQEAGIQIGRGSRGESRTIVLTKVGKVSLIPSVPPETARNIEVYPDDTTDGSPVITKVPSAENANAVADSDDIDDTDDN